MEKEKKKKHRKKKKEETMKKEEKKKKQEEKKKEEEKQRRKKKGEAQKKEAREKTRKEEGRMRERTDEERMRTGQKGKTSNDIGSERGQRLITRKDGPSPCKLPRASPQGSDVSGTEVAIPGFQGGMSLHADESCDESARKESNLESFLEAIVASDARSSASGRRVTLQVEHMTFTKKYRGESHSSQKPLAGCFVGSSSKVAVCGRNMFPKCMDLTCRTSSGDPRTFDFKMNGIDMSNTREAAESENRQRIALLDRKVGLYVFDAMTMKWIARNGGLKNLVGLACLEDDLFVSYDGSQNSLVFIDAEKAVITHVKKLPQWEDDDPVDESPDSESRSRIRSLAIHKSHEGVVRIALVDRGKDRILVVDESGNHLVTIHEFPNYFLMGRLKFNWPLHRDGFNRPFDAAFLPDGRLLVSDTDNGRILLFDQAGDVVQPVAIQSLHVIKPSFLKVGREENGQIKVLVGFLGASWRHVPSGVAVLKFQD